MRQHRPINYFPGHVPLSIHYVGADGFSLPIQPGRSGAFSCQELADKLAAAQTETAASVLTSTWDESGCTQKAAGEQLYRDVPVTVEVTRVVPVTVPVTRVVVKEVPVTKIIPETTIIMVTPELSRNSSLAGTTWRFTKTYSYGSGTTKDSDVREFHSDGTWGYQDYISQAYKWEQSGDTVHIYTNSKYSTEIGTVSGDRISGPGSDVKGTKWTSRGIPH